jgi:shikimate dehydrogenase
MRTEEIGGTTALYAIIGDPISAVRSPAVFNGMFARQGIDAVMVALHVPVSDLSAAWAGLKATRNLAGVVFTMPHKAAAIHLVDTVGTTGQLVGAINAARREPDGSWSGDMFDGHGFVLGLSTRGYPVAGRSAFLIGAGGAGVAIAAALAEAGARSIVIDDISQERRDEAISRVRCAYPSVAVSSGSLADEVFDFAINVTPAGMAKHDPMPFDPKLLPTSTLVVDVVTKPEMTPLLIAAQASGHLVHAGRHMHYGQAIGVARFFGFDLESPAE